MANQRWQKSDSVTHSVADTDTYTHANAHTNSGSDAATVAIAKPDAIAYSNAHADPVAITRSGENGSACFGISHSPGAGGDPGSAGRSSF